MQFDATLESTNLTLAKHLAKDNIVYYVDRPYTWRDYFTFKNTPGYNARKAHFFSGSDCLIETDNPNLKIVITPPVPSINMLPEGKAVPFCREDQRKNCRHPVKKIDQKA